MSRRVAVCLSGLPRNVNNSFNHIKEYVIDALRADVFCHFWNNNTDRWCEPDKILLFNPIKYELENHLPVLRTQSMFYSIFKSNELKSNYESDNNFVYDIVVRCRTDLHFRKRIREDINVDDGTVLVWSTTAPDGRYHEGFFPDTIGIGTSRTMNIYSQIFNTIQTTDHIAVPEYLLYEYLKKHNIRDKHSEDLAHELSRLPFV